VKVFFIGDIIGKPGRQAVKALLSKSLEREKFDLILANGENAAGGFGITPGLLMNWLRMELTSLPRATISGTGKRLLIFWKKRIFF